MGCIKLPCAMPPPMIHKSVSTTPLHSNTLILPTASILRYNNTTIKITTPPLTSFDSSVVSGTKKVKYEAKPKAAEAITNGACIMVCQTNKKLSNLPDPFSPYDSFKKLYDPPAFGNAAPSSLHTIASINDNAAPVNQAYIK